MRTVDIPQEEACPVSNNLLGSDDWPVMVVKWHALSLKRLEHFGELRRTGRWRHYFATEDAFEEAFRTASANVEKWQQLAHRSAS
jgi:hypothetical protein